MSAQAQGGGDVPPLLELSAVSKSFGGVAAIKDVDFRLSEGEIHGLIGENGAGKSTSMKVIAGVHSDYDGVMRVGGRQVRFRNARDALDAGIGMVHQELSTVPDLSVAENVFLGQQPLTRFGTVDWRRINREARQLIASLGLDIDPTTTMGALPVGIQQLVELSRVLFSGARIIILDEPTSALSPPEVKRLFDVLRKIRADGRGIVFISHFLDDVLEISDSVTVFRNGRTVASGPAAGLSKDEMISSMIGRGSIGMHMGESAELASDDSKPVVMEAEAIGDGKMLRDVSLKLRAGEITGVYGFMGCGQIEFARAAFGKIPLKQGRMLIDGQEISFRSTADAKNRGIAFVPENRSMMLFRTEPIYKNVSIAILERIHRLLLKPDAERSITKTHIDDLQIKTQGADMALGSLSGGNQQKVALAKWLTHLPKVLILSEPTRGMDVGAKEDVIRIIKKLRERGVAILVLSSEPETILTLADRVTVLRKGVVAREFSSGILHKADLLSAA
ncbi:sugar ABC transporter ATP-binding protein [Denitrobaculum tricleocarpae]|uniref:Sugar ABC transporter ATP-binding protein n=1 Tax=Denitrobaculum tricleocarpae TaxID=2591009 RepID=A0A545U2F9_9PROT|nr:sugar ABC transporter ATP-binding protein [Denitrobaculum tricleocarpae]TQV83593.1 sugar ABC transporter ATP-binding protein [Denitrobaculum tricleocarpae]